MPRTGLIAIRCAERFQMHEGDYLLDRVLRGYSARAMARELDVSHTAIISRLRTRSIADIRPGPWQPCEALNAA